MVIRASVRAHHVELATGNQKLVVSVSDAKKLAQALPTLLENMGHTVNSQHAIDTGTSRTTRRLLKPLARPWLTGVASAISRH